MRRYNCWGGNPHGIGEDIARCVVEVFPTISFGGHQCFRKRGHGPDSLYCKQHGRIAAAHNWTLYVPKDAD